MRLMRAITTLMFVSLAPSSNAFADLRVSISGDGRVSISARDATASQILTEWGRIGQTTIVNGEKIPRDPITIELESVSEEQALGVLLRTASGYLAAERTVAVPNASRFDRIIVMPPSVVVSAAPAAAPREARAGAQPAYPVSTYAQPEPFTQPSPPPDDASQQPPAYVSSAAPGVAADTGSDEPPFVSEAGAVAPAPPPDPDHVQAPAGARDRGSAGVQAAGTPTGWCGHRSAGGCGATVWRRRCPGHDCSADHASARLVVDGQVLRHAVSWISVSE